MRCPSPRRLASRWSRPWPWPWPWLCPWGGGRISAAQPFVAACGQVHDQLKLGGMVRPPAVAHGRFRLADGPQSTAGPVEPSTTAVRPGGNQPSATARGRPAVVHGRFWPMGGPWATAGGGRNVTELALISATALVGPRVAERRRRTGRSEAALGGGARRRRPEAALGRRDRGRGEVDGQTHDRLKLSGTARRPARPQGAGRRRPWRAGRRGPWRAGRRGPWRAGRRGPWRAGRRGPWR